MKKYEVPLKVVGQGLNHRNIALARMMFDTMSEAEMREPAPVDDVEGILQSYPGMDEEDHFRRLLDADMKDRLEQINVKKEAENIPKNYDVAIALAAEQMDEAKNVMEFLTKTKQAKNALKLDVFESFEEYEEHARKMAEIIMEQREDDIKDSIIRGEKEDKD